MSTPSAAAPGAPAAPIEVADVLAGCTVDVAGIPIRIEASDPRRAEAVASLFRHATRVDARPQCSLRFAGLAVSVPATDATAQFATAALWRPAPGELLIRVDDGLTATSDAAAIVVGGDAHEILRVFRYVCVLALTHLLAQHGRFLLHAGAVVVDGRAVLVLGDTGSGKSTLVFAAHRLGWPVLSDDVVALHRTGDGIVAQGLPRPVSVPRDVLAGPIPGGRPVPEDLRERTELPAGTLAPGVHAVAGLVVTGLGDGPDPTVEPMDAHEALRSALRANPSLGDPALRAEVLALAAALARTPAWSLRHGSVPAAAIADATHQLRTVRHLLGGPPADRS